MACYGAMATVQEKSGCNAAARSRLGPGQPGWVLTCGKLQLGGLGGGEWWVLTGCYYWLLLVVIWVINGCYWLECAFFTFFFSSPLIQVVAPNGITSVVWSSWWLLHIATTSTPVRHGQTKFGTGKSKCLCRWVNQHDGSRFWLHGAGFGRVLQISAPCRANVWQEG